MNSYRFKIVLAGDESVGKSCCIRRFVDDSYSESYKPTLGFEVSVKIIQIEQLTIICSIFDVAGQKSYQNLRKSYYSGATGVILMFDQTNHKTLVNIGEWFREIREVVPKSPVLLVGNKNDLPQKQVTPEDVSLAMKVYGFPAFVQTSAKTGEGIQEMFLCMGKLMVESKTKKAPEN